MTISLDHRDELGHWLNGHGLTGEGAEIGVARGDFAKTVLENWSGQRYHMIDPWKPQPSSVYMERQPTEEEYERWRLACYDLSQRDKRVRLMQSTSHNGSYQFSDESLDWVYIDGNHSYRAVEQDLDDWWPKVREGGLFAGHDFVNKQDEGWYCQVADAVTEWAHKMKLPFTVTSACRSWWILKP